MKLNFFLFLGSCVIKQLEHRANATKCVFIKKCRESSKYLKQYIFSLCTSKNSLLDYLDVVIWILAWILKATTASPCQSLHTHTHTLSLHPPPCTLTDADALIIQFGRGVAEVSQSAVLAVLAPGVVLAADACDDLQVFDVAAAVGVAVALTV